MGKEVGFDDFTLERGADIADMAGRRLPDPSDQAAVRLGIELRDRYGPDQLRPEHVHQAIAENWDKLVKAGTVVPD